jgi:hypothetical protein
MHFFRVVVGVKSQFVADGIILLIQLRYVPLFDSARDVGMRARRG